MKDYAEAFYKSPAWKKTRETYAKSKGGLCEICLARGIYNAGVIVHHKEHITPATVNDPMVALNWDNLQLVCRDCHAELHSNKEGSRFVFDEQGHIVATNPGE